jgi:hypothetical protein
MMLDMIALCLSWADMVAINSHWSSKYCDEVLVPALEHALQLNWTVHPYRCYRNVSCVVLMKDPHSWPQCRILKL